MKAVVYDRYGGPEVLRLEDVKRPTPGPGEVLVRVVAAGVATGDRHLMRGDPFLVRLVFGLRRPKLRILGSDVAGRVEAVGPGVTEFAPGDDVFGHLADAGFGGFAEYVVAPVGAVVAKPEGVSFEQAAAVPGSALAALQGLRDTGRLTSGHRVLVNGASGGVGPFAVQIARTMGAHVTGVCSTRNIDFVGSLGADRVVDYTVEDALDGHQRYDLVLDAAAHRSVRASLRAVMPGGAYVLVGGAGGVTVQAMLLGPFLGRATGKRVAFFITKVVRADLATLAGMMARGELTAEVDVRPGLEAVPGALRHIESKRGRGKVVVALQA